MKLSRIITISICVFLYGYVIGLIGQALGVPFIVHVLFSGTTVFVAGWYMYDWLMKD